MMIGNRVNSNSTRILVERGYDDIYPGIRHWLFHSAKSKLLYQFNGARFSEYEYKTRRSTPVWWGKFWDFSSARWEY